MSWQVPGSVKAQISDIAIRDLDSLLQAAEEARGKLDQPSMPKSAVWFRGQPASDQWLPLVPKVFRNGRFAGHERDIAILFQHGAVARDASCPPLTEYVHWMCLMRHHGLPTRVLDWSESALVAAFFAMESSNVPSRTVGTVVY